MKTSRWMQFTLGALSCIALAACGSGDSGAPSAATNIIVASEGPLSPRSGAVLAAVDNTVLVFGGNDFACPPNADCELPDVPPFADGAAYDVAADTWSAIADAPTGIEETDAAVIDDTVYALIQCDKSARCPIGRAMLSYDVAGDSWSVLAGVPGKGFHMPVVVADELFAISTTDELDSPDYRYDIAADGWVPLPEVPMAPAYDRFGIDAEGTLVVYGSPIEDGNDSKMSASFDQINQSWTELTQAPGMGFQPYSVDERVVLNPHFGREGGGIHDVGGDSWAPLPDPPDSDSWRGDIVGVIGADTAVYESPAGWVLDLRTDDWFELSTPGGFALGGASVIATGTDLFVFGGHYWTDNDVRVDGATVIVPAP